jgi:hypothetical protein
MSGDQPPALLLEGPDTNCRISLGKRPDMFPHLCTFGQTGVDRADNLQRSNVGSMIFWPLSSIIQRWTTQDDERLRTFVAQGASLVRASAALKRGHEVVRERARKLGCSFPPRSEARKNGRIVRTANGGISDFGLAQSGSRRPAYYRCPSIRRRFKLNSLENQPLTLDSIGSLAIASA